LPWYLGALGELDVARSLDSLGPEWRVFRAVPIGTGSSDIDHVVIGPPGVFTINTKHHQGKDIWIGAKLRDDVRRSRSRRRGWTVAIVLAISAAYAMVWSSFLAFLAA